MTTCGKEIYHSRSVAVCVMVYTIKDDITLVAAVERGPAVDKPGTWCLSCGYVDWDETIEQAARREVYEELGLTCKELEFIGIDSEPSSHLQNITINYATQIEHQSLHADNAEQGEISSLKWLRIGELAHYTWAFHHDELVRRFFQKGEMESSQL